MLLQTSFGPGDKPCVISTTYLASLLILYPPNHGLGIGFGDYSLFIYALTVFICSGILAFLFRFQVYRHSG